MTANTNQANSCMNKTMPLSQAMKEAPNVSGCYQIFCDGQLVYVGKAQDGIRKRFVQYYNGTTAHYTSAQKILSEKDRISVKWTVISEPTEVIRKEADWIKKYKPEWNKQSGWGDKGVLTDSSVKVNPVKGEVREIGKSAAASAGATAILEVGKGILKEETAGQCTEHTVSKSLEAGVGGGAFELGRMLGSPLGPVVSTLAGVATAAIANEVVEGAFDEIGFHAGVLADEVVEKVGDVAFDVGMGIASIGDVIMDNPITNGVSAVCENVALGVEGLFDSVFSWFW